MLGFAHIVEGASNLTLNMKTDIKFSKAIMKKLENIIHRKIYLTSLDLHIMQTVLKKNSK